MTTETLGLSVDDAAAAFMTSWGAVDALETEETSPEASEPQDDVTPEEVTQEEGVEDETTEEEVSEEPTEEVSEDPDAAEVEVRFGDEVKAVTLKDLKEKFIKAQAVEETERLVSETKAKVDAEGARYAAGLERMFKAAEERFKPYAEADDLVLMKELSAEAFAQYRKDKTEAYQEYNFFKAELDSTFHNLQTRQMETQRAAAEAAIKVLTDPEKGIPGWSPTLYDEIRTHAKSMGMAAQMVDSIVDPAAIKLLHDAMLYRKAQKAAAEKVVKKTFTPKKVIKTTTPVTNSTASKPAKAQALSQLRKSGSVDDAARAFLAGWSDD
jgi:hypothetical protein